MKKHLLFLALILGQFVALAQNDSASTEDTGAVETIRPDMTEEEQFLEGLVRNDSKTAQNEPEKAEKDTVIPKINTQIKILNVKEHQRPGNKLGWIIVIITVILPIVCFFVKRYPRTARIVGIFAGIIGIITFIVFLIKNFPQKEMMVQKEFRPAVANVPIASDAPPAQRAPAAKRSEQTVYAPPPPVKKGPDSILVGTIIVPPHEYRVWNVPEGKFHAWWFGYSVTAMTDDGRTNGTGFKECGRVKSFEFYCTDSVDAVVKIYEIVNV